ncbi:MAG TPA: hypothetical protein H9887_03725 [Candidatus Dorea intestinavium]|nr:hypothetical protein [Candidatus Dorea intestinavium]
MRFAEKEIRFPLKNIILSLLLFLFIVIGFWFFAESLNQKGSGEELKTLDTAIRHAVTQCYAIEGSYPESLDYLKEHYGISYNERRFIVHYEVFGQNILPNITIIQKEALHE